MSRSSGRSSVAAAAYRSGERLTDERAGKVHDFTRRRAAISTEILAPDGAPAWTRDRAQLWNRAEAAERRRDAQTAREIEVSLPRELSATENRDLVRRYVRSQFTRRGMVADVAYHDLEGDHPHAHILLTTRPLDGDRFGNKNRTWNDRKLGQAWREAWAAETNRSLADAGRPERVDHRRLAAQRAEALERGDVAAAIRLDRDPQLTRGPTLTHRPTQAPDRATVYADAEAIRIGQIALAERDAREYEARGIRVAAAEEASPHQHHADLRRIRGSLARLGRAADPPTLGDVRPVPELPRLDIALRAADPPALGDVRPVPELPRLDIALRTPQPVPPATTAPAAAPQAETSVPPARRAADALAALMAPPSGAGPPSTVPAPQAETPPAPQQGAQEGGARPDADPQDRSRQSRPDGTGGRQRPEADDEIAIDRGAAAESFRTPTRTRTRDKTRGL